MANFDVEDESILSTVFKDSFPDAWRDNAEFAQYLAELSSYGVEKLNREPDRLAEERTQILEQTQDLAFHNYKTFIQTAECSKEIFQDFQVIEKHVSSMLDKLPRLNTACDVFLKEAQEINTSRRMNNVTLQRHTQLLEILEVPQLMDTCVRNGYYEEALELAAHVRRLEKKHANIPVIISIVNEVKSSTQLMLSQLLQQLRTNLQLPACLRVIGYLRRMDVFTEAELRIKFLQARDSWFQAILSNVPDDDAYYHITKVIEASRVHLFDIITQYRAIFSDDDSMVATVTDETSNESALFHGWVVQKVTQFLQTLERDLQRGVGGRLDSLLGQCMYFGLSFSRVGADFRGLLAPIFQHAILTGFGQTINQTSARLEEAMQSYTLLGSVSTLPSSAFSLSSQASGSLQPPSVLLEYQPLAVYCNMVLGAFNETRLCAPLSLACDVASLVQESLHKAAECVLAYHRAEETTFNMQETEKFSHLCRVFAEELVPFLNKCLQVLFPPSQLAQTLGVHVSDLVKMGHIGTLDIEAVLSPIAHLIPAKPEEPQLPAIGSEDESDDQAVKTDQSQPSIQEIPDAVPDRVADARLSVSGDQIDRSEPEQARTESGSVKSGSIKSQEAKSEKSHPTSVKSVKSDKASVTSQPNSAKSSNSAEVDSASVTSQTKSEAGSVTSQTKSEAASVESQPEADSASLTSQSQVTSDTATSAPVTSLEDGSESSILSVKSEDSPAVGDDAEVKVDSPVVGE